MPDHLFASEITGEGPLVLVADDSRAIRLLSARTLQQDGFAVLQVSDGSLVLAALRELFAAGKPPALLLMDINMPNMDGITCLRNIRNDPVIAATPVVMASTENERKTILSCAALGVSGYVIKPYTTDKLLTEVRRFVRGAHGEAAGAAATPAGAEDGDGDPIRKKIAVILERATAVGEKSCASWDKCPVIQALQHDILALFPSKD